MDADLAKQEAAFNQFINKQLPNKMLELAQDIVDTSFRQEKYPDIDSDQWDGRKNDSESRKAREDRRALMVKSGDLLKSEVAYKKGNIIYIGTDEVYAQIHNEGLNGKAFGKYTFKMPQRQSMPIPGEEPPTSFQIPLNVFIDKKMNKIDRMI